MSAARLSPFLDSINDNHNHHNNNHSYHNNGHGNGNGNGRSRKFSASTQDGTLHIEDVHYAISPQSTNNNALSPATTVTVALSTNSHPGAATQVVHNNLGTTMTRIII